MGKGRGHGMKIGTAFFFILLILYILSKTLP